MYLSLRNVKLGYLSSSTSLNRRYSSGDTSPLASLNRRVLSASSSVASLPVGFVFLLIVQWQVLSPLVIILSYLNSKSASSFPTIPLKNASYCAQISGGEAENGHSLTTPWARSPFISIVPLR